MKKIKILIVFLKCLKTQSIQFFIKLKVFFGESPSVPAVHPDTNLLHNLGKKIFFLLVSFFFEFMYIYIHTHVLSEIKCINKDFFYWISSKVELPSKITTRRNNWNLGNSEKSRKESFTTWLGGALQLSMPPTIFTNTSTYAE